MTLSPTTPLNPPLPTPSPTGSGSGDMTPTPTPGSGSGDFPTLSPTPNLNPPLPTPSPTSPVQGECTCREMESKSGPGKDKDFLCECLGENGEGEIVEAENCGPWGQALTGACKGGPP